MKKIIFTLICLSNLLSGNAIFGMEEIIEGKALGLQELEALTLEDAVKQVEEANEQLGKAHHSLAKAYTTASILLIKHNAEKGSYAWYTAQDLANSSRKIDDAIWSTPGTIREIKRWIKHYEDEDFYKKAGSAKHKFAEWK